MALLNIFESFPETIVFSDSSATVSLFEECQGATRESEFFMHSDFDVACRLFRCVSPLSQVRKIKAHRSIATIGNWLDQYHALGNMKANDEAIKARDELLPSVFKI